jgi:hypothetical protein
MVKYPNMNLNIEDSRPGFNSYRIVIHFVLGYSDKSGMCTIVGLNGILVEDKMPTL